MKKHVLKLKSKPLSWSSLSSWDYDKNQWARKYLDGISDPPNSQMLFGNEIGNKIANDPTFLPEVLRYKQFEKGLGGKIGDIELIGFLDSFCPKHKYFKEYKTSSNTKRWTKKTTNEHGQLDFYYLLIWLNYSVAPENIDCELFYIPVEEGQDFRMKLSDAPIQSFKVKKTVLDILKFGKFIQKTYKEMEIFAKKYKGLSQ